MKSKIFQIIKITFLSLIVSVGLGVATAFWTPSPSSPPSNNSAQPIYASSQDQGKKGGLVIGSDDLSLLDKVFDTFTYHLKLFVQGHMAVTGEVWTTKDVHVGYLADNISTTDRHVCTDADGKLQICGSGGPTCNIESFNAKLFAGNDKDFKQYANVSGGSQTASALGGLKVSPSQLVAGAIGGGTGGSNPGPWIDDGNPFDPFGDPAPCIGAGTDYGPSEYTYIQRAYWFDWKVTGADKVVIETGPDKTDGNKSDDWLFHPLDWFGTNTLPMEWPGDESDATYAYTSEANFPDGVNPLIQGPGHYFYPVLSPYCSISYKLRCFNDGYNNPSDPNTNKSITVSWQQIKKTSPPPPPPSTKLTVSGGVGGSCVGGGTYFQGYCGSGDQCYTAYTVTASSTKSGYHCNWKSPSVLNGSCSYTHQFTGSNFTVDPTFTVDVISSSGGVTTLSHKFGLANAGLCAI